MIAINLTGVWRTLRATLPSMVEKGAGGSAVLTGSIAGIIGMPYLAHYAAAKHGVNGMVKSLANELAPHRIRVNSVNPTNVATPMILNDATYQHFRPDVPGADNTKYFTGLSVCSRSMASPLAGRHGCRERTCLLVRHDDVRVEGAGPEDPNPW